MMSNGTTSPEWPPQITRRPSFASESSPFWKSSPPTCSKTRSTPRPSVSRITSSTTSCVLWLIPWSIPSSAARASFSSELALPITVAPARRASWTAAEPIPLPTELIITVSVGGEPAAREQHVPRRPEGDLERGRRLVGELLGHAHQVPGGADELLGVAAGGAEADEAGGVTERLAAGPAVAAVAAMVHQERHHAVAGLPALDALADLCDPADDLDPEDERRLDREARQRPRGRRRPGG